MRAYNHQLDLDERAMAPPTKSETTKMKRTKAEEELPDVTDAYMEESWRTGNMSKVRTQCQTPGEQHAEIILWCR
jgi:hypothetical protein